MLGAALAPTRVAISQTGAVSERRLTVDSTPASQSNASATAVFVGNVLTTTGEAAAGTVVVTDLGGYAVTDANGSFQVEAQVPAGVDNVQVTAVGRSSASVVASRQVQLRPSQGPLAVGSLRLALTGGCNAQWLPTFGGDSGTNGDIHATTTAAVDYFTSMSDFVGTKFVMRNEVVEILSLKWE